MKVSAITPTKGRSHLHPALYEVFCNQNHPDVELLVADSGPDGPSPFFATLADPRVRYFFLDVEQSIGWKRNFLIARSRGDVIVHFDDDDYYHPDYASQAIVHLEKCDFITARSWYNYAPIQNSLYFWDTTWSAAYQFLSSGQIRQRMASSHFLEAAQWGYGFSYAYRRELHQRIHFPDQYMGEDFAFAQQVRAAFRAKTYADEEGLVFHTLWPQATSKVFPQYRLPPFMLDQRWPQVRDHYDKYFPQIKDEELNDLIFANGTD